MKDTEKFVVVRELYPETRGSIFRTMKCPPVDKSREVAYGMDASGNVVRLADEKARDAAAKNGNRIFAVNKKHTDFSNVFLHVCTEDGYEWNYAMEGVIKVSDASKFLSAWVRDEGSCGLDGIDSDRFAHLVLSRLEPVVRDQISECRKAHGYRIADIQEKDALPSLFWTAEFANSSDPMLAGLDVEVADKAFLSPDLEMEEKLNAAAAAQRELENQAKAEWQAIVNGRMAEAELEEMDRQRKRAELAFEKEQAELEAAIKKQKVDIAIYEANQLNEAKIRLQKALNDEEIRKQQAVGNIESERVQAMGSAMDEVLKKLESVMDRLGNLGVAAADVATKVPDVVQDPVVTPRYQGMSDNFLSVMQSLKEGANDGIAISLEAVRRSGGCATRSVLVGNVGVRDVFSVRKEDNGMKFNGVLHVGDRMTLRLKSPRSGYLTLFNFGTSGRVSKIFPHPAFGMTSNHVKAGCVYMLPGALMSADILPDGEWEEQGPVSSSTGLPERILAVLTDKPVELDETCFGAQVGRVLTRGGFDVVEESISSLLDLPHGSWIWGMVEAAVED